eukprot:GEMP01011615.1.p1 GENE.GEMP01011615.1~~GEMP01011615.1.p1  ORF type:complete len:741 (+),score=178.38 GEMP01011615.1:156-2378(+)
MADSLDTYSDSESEVAPALPSVTVPTPAKAAPASTPASTLVASDEPKPAAGAENMSAVDRSLVAAAKASRVDDAKDAGSSAMDVVESTRPPRDALSLVAMDDPSAVREALKQRREKSLVDYEHRQGEARKKEADSKEEFTKLKIVNRLIPKEEWNRLMKGKQFYPFSNISTMGTGKQDKSTASSVFIGVLYDKISTKTAASGNKYATWLMADMKGSQPLQLAVQLYDQAFELWSQNVDKSRLASRGSMFAILNGKVFPPRADGKGTASARSACSVSHGMQLAKLGDFPDLGFCTGEKKSDNRPCGTPIDKSMANFGLCFFHSRERLKKMGGKPHLNNLIASCVPQQRMHSRLEARVEEKQTLANKQKERELEAERKKISSSARVQRAIDFDRRLLSVNSTRNKEVLEALTSGRSVRSTDASVLPMLGRGLTKDEELIFDNKHTKSDDFLSKLKKRNLPKEAELPATSKLNNQSSKKVLTLESLQRPVVQKQLPSFPTADPNNPLATKRRMQQAFGRANAEREDKRPKIDLQQESKEEEKKQKNPTKSAEELQEEFARMYGKAAASKLVMSKAEMDSVRNAKSLRAELVTIEKTDERERVRQELEFRDDFDLQKATVLFLEIDAWYCATCKLTSDQVSAKIACEAMNHTVTAKKVKKTRWECRKCMQSAFVIDRTMPSGCLKCGNDTFKQASFFKLKSVAMEKDMLEKRGADHERYLEQETKRRAMNDDAGHDVYGALDKY